MIAVVPVLINPLLVLVPILAGMAVAVAGILVRLFRPQALKAAAKLAWRSKLPLAVVAIVLGGGIWAAHAFWPEFGPDVGAAEGGEDWPMIRGGPARLGAPPGGVGPARGGVRWTRTGPAFFASPALVGNRLYVTTARLGMFGGGSGVILCLDAETGGTVWQSAPDGYRATFSSPVVSGRYLVVGEGLHMTRDARVVCLDVARGGRVLWTWRTSSHVECAPVILEDRVVVGAGDDGYYCFALEPDENGEARLLWHVDGARYPDAETSLAAADGKIYAGLGLGGMALCVLDAATGEELARIRTGLPVFSPPAIAGGKLYVGMGTGDYVNQAETLGEQPAGEVWCLDLARIGEEGYTADWRFKVGRTVLGAVAVADDSLYFGSRDGFVYRLGRDGSLLRKWNARASIVTSPAVTSEYVYVMTDAGTLYGLVRETLEPVWEVQVGTEPLFISSPAAGRGHVYVGSQHDGLVCAGEPGRPPVPLWPGHLGGPGRAGSDESPLPAFGEFRWQYPPEAMGTDDAALVTASPAVLAGRLYVPLAGQARRGLVCLPVQKAAAEAPPPAWTHETTHPVTISPAARGETVFVVDGAPGDEGRTLVALAAAGGAVRWTRPVEAAATGIVSATDTGVLVQREAGRLARFELDGRQAWSVEVGRMAGLPEVLDAMLVVATVEPPALAALDRPTGKVLWREAVADVPATAPVVREGAVYLGTRVGVLARSLFDGRPVPAWDLACAGVAGELAVAGDLLACITVEGELVLGGRLDGLARRRVAGAVPGTTPMIARARVYWIGEGAIMQMPLDDPNAAPQPWTDVSWLGRPAGPMVLAGSRLYGGRTGWGLVVWGAGR